MKTEKRAKESQGHQRVASYADGMNASGVYPQSTETLSDLRITGKTGPGFRLDKPSAKSRRRPRSTVGKLKPARLTPIKPELPDRARYRIAIHEAGHAIAGYLLGYWVTGDGLRLFNSWKGFTVA